MKEIRKSVMCFVVALCTILVTLLPQVVYADKEFSDSTYAGHIYCISNDSGHGQLVAGDEFTLEGVGTVNGYNIATSNQATVTYSWSVSEECEDVITLRTDSDDTSHCHVKLGKNISAGNYCIYMSFSVYDDNGKLHTVTGYEYSFSVVDEHYEIVCELPKNVNNGQAFTFKPYLTKVVPNEKDCIVTDLKEIYEVDTDDDVNLFENSDGSYTIIPTKNDVMRISIRAVSSDNLVYYASTNYDINVSEPSLSFLSSSYRFYVDEKVNVGLSLSGLYMKYGDDYSVELYIDCGYGEFKIDKSEYDVTKIDDEIYLTFHGDLNKKIGGLSQDVLRAVAVKNGDPLCETTTVLEVFNKLEKIRVGEPQKIYKSFYSALSMEEEMQYIVDSVTIDDPNIVKLVEAESCWTYQGIAEGETTIHVKRHYYKGTKRIEDDYDNILQVLDANYSINYGVVNTKVYPGGSRCVQLNLTAYKYVNGHNVEVDINQGDIKWEAATTKANFAYGDAKGKASIVDGNKLKITVDPDSTYGTIAATVTARRADGKVLAIVNANCDIATEKDYSYWDNVVSENKSSVTLKPELIEYSIDNPSGINVTNKYDMTISYSYGDVFTDVINQDGTVTFNRIAGKENESDVVTFKWVDDSGAAVYYGSYVLKQADTQIVEPTNPDISEDEKEPLVKNMGQSVMFDNQQSIALNIYWNVENVNMLSLKVWFEDEPDNIWYAPARNLYFNTNGFNFRSTIKVNSGEYARTMKVQLISDKGKVIGEVTTSVKEYALKIINSNDEKYEKYKNLAKTILNYGAASQEYFNYYVDSLANSDLTINDKKIDDIPNDQLLKYRNNDQLHYCNGIQFYGSSLILDNQLTDRLYFKLDERYDPDYFRIQTSSSSSKGWLISSEPKLIHYRDNIYYFDLPEYDKFIGRDVNISINSDSMIYNPMNYIYRVYKTTTDINLKNLIKALYWMEYQKQQLSA